MFQSGHGPGAAPDIRLARTLLVSAALAIALISVLLIALTYRISISPQTIPLEWQWNLRWEHNFAAWWSGSLLAVAAVLALDNAAHAGSAPLRKAWITFAAITLFLSLDEVGSLHERMGAVSQSLNAGSWALAIPLGIVIAIFSIKAGWALLIHGERERAQVIGIAIGFAVLLSVAVQEYLEHAIDWQALELGAIRAMVEEGSELVGTVIVLAAIGWPLWWAPDTAFFSLRRYATPLLFASLLIALPCFAISTDLSDQRGYPSDWLASALFLFAALVSLRCAWAGERPLAAVVLAACCALASLASVAMGPDEHFGIAGLEVSRRALVYALTGLALLAAAYRSAGLTVFAGAAMLLALQASDSVASPLLSFLIGPACGFAAFWGLSRAEGAARA